MINTNDTLDCGPSPVSLEEFSYGNSSTACLIQHSLSETNFTGLSVSAYQCTLREHLKLLRHHFHLLLFYFQIRDQFISLAQEYEHKTLLDCYSTEMVSLQLSLNRFILYVIIIGSLQLRLQKLADISLDTMSFNYVAEENKSTVWPGKTCQHY